MMVFVVVVVSCDPGVVWWCCDVMILLGDISGGMSVAYSHHTTVTSHHDTILCTELTLA